MAGDAPCLALPCCAEPRWASALPNAEPASLNSLLYFRRKQDFENYLKTLNLICAVIFVSVMFLKRQATTLVKLVFFLKYKNI